MKQTKSMAHRIFTAPEALALLEGLTPPPWRAYETTFYDSEDTYWEVSHRVEIPERMREPDSSSVVDVNINVHGFKRADAHLVAAAPDLAASVAHYAQRASDAEAERDALRAIIEGRPVPPTREEADALVWDGGYWRFHDDGAEDGVCNSWDAVAAAIVRSAARGGSLRWWAIDLGGSPRAWPVVPADSR